MHGAGEGEQLMFAFEKTTFTDYGNLRVLHAPIELDVYTAPDFREATIDTVANGFHRLVVDLSKTTFIDSTGLGVLVGAKKRCESHGGWLRLAKPQRDVRHMLWVTGLLRVFVIENDVEAAIAAQEVSS